MEKLAIARLGSFRTYISSKISMAKKSTIQPN
jgi:hypothetical protein